MRITAIERPPRKHRYEVRIDHTMVVPLSAEVLAQANLRPGQEISSERIDALQIAEARHSGLAAALRLLACRSRSEKEMREALQRRGVPDGVLAETLARLRELRLLDDHEFARSYVELRDRASPRGLRMLKAELLSKGVPRADIDGSLASVDEHDAAFRAGARRARTLRGCSYGDFQRKLGDHLLRRGFGYETANETVKRLWAAREDGTED